MISVFVGLFVVMICVLIMTGRLVPGKTGLQVRRDKYTADGAREANGEALPDPYDTAYPIRTLDEVLAGLPAEIRWRFTAAAQACIVGPAKHDWMVRRDDVRNGQVTTYTYTWTCRRCDTTTDNQELVISQGWRPRSLPVARKTTRQFLRDLDAELAIEAPPVEIGQFGAGGFIRANAFAEHLRRSQCDLDREIEMEFDAARGRGYR